MDSPSRRSSLKPKSSRTTPRGEFTRMPRPATQRRRLRLALRQFPQTFPASRNAAPAIILYNGKRHSKKLTTS